MKKIILNIALLVIPIFTFTSCELFGLDVQTPYDYDSEKGTYDNQITMNAWDFMNSRTDLFSSLIEAIKYSGVDPELFKQPDRTYLLLTNTALTSSNSSDRSFWNENAYPDEFNPEQLIIPTSWEELDKTVVKNMIMYHIIKKALSYYELTDLTKGVITFFPTEYDSPYGYMAVEMLKGGALSIYFNNYEDHFQLKTKPRTSNLQSPNGSYIHVMDKYMQYPTDKELVSIPIYGAK